MSSHEMEDFRDLAESRHARSTAKRSEAARLIPKESATITSGNVPSSWVQRYHDELLEKGKDPVSQQEFTPMEGWLGPWPSTDRQ